MQTLKVPKLWRKVFNLPLSALLGKGPPKLCWVWTYHTSSTACISYLGRTKSYFKVALSHSKASFKKKSKSTIKQKKSPKSPQKCIVWQSKPQNSLNIYTSNFVDWLQEPLGGRKTIFKLLCLTQIWVLRKNQRALSNREKLQKQFEIWFRMRCLAEHTPKSTKGQYTKFCWLIARDHREKSKIISKLLFLIRRLVLTKNGRAIQRNQRKTEKKCKKVLNFIMGALLAEHAPKSANY